MEDHEDKKPSNRSAWGLLTDSLLGQRVLDPDEPAPIPNSFAIPAGTFGIGGLLEFIPDDATIH